MGIYFVFEFVIDDEVEVVVVETINDIPNSEKKETGIVKIDISVLTLDEVYHVYIFEGAETKEFQPGYIITNPNSYNLLLVYYDPSELYGNNLGVMIWNTGENLYVSNWDKLNKTLSDEREVRLDLIMWGLPISIFSTGSVYKNRKVQIGLVASDNQLLSLLIYEGSDENKKNGRYIIYSR